MVRGISHGTEDCRWRPPRTRIYRDANQAIGAGVWTAVSFNGIWYGGSDPSWSAVNPTRLSIQTSGRYEIYGCSFITGGVHTQVAIRLNGLNWLNAWYGGDAAAAQDIWTAKGIFELVRGNYLELMCYTTAGGNIFFLADITPHMWAHWVSPLAET